MNRKLVVFALAPLLAGCWTSDSGLMPPTRRVAPPISGIYRNVDERGRSQGPARWLVTNADATSSAVKTNDEYVDGWKDDAMLAYDRLPGGDFLIQQDSEDGTYGYALLRVTAAGAEIFIPSCSEAVRAMPGVSRDSDEDECYFTDYAAVRRAALALDRRIAGGDESALEYHNYYERVGNAEDAGN